MADAGYPLYACRTTRGNVGRLENSAFSKYEAGLELITHPTGIHQGAGIYLMGYVAEMLLKSASFRFKDNPPNPSRCEVDRTKLANARAEVERLRLLAHVPASIDHDGYHSIEFWAFLLREMRRGQGRPWTNIAFDTQFRACTDRLHNNWHVSMRYYADTSLTLDALSVAEDATWLVNNYKSLWN